MRLADGFFESSCGFLAGVFLASLFYGFSSGYLLIGLGIALISAVIIFLRRFRWLFLIPFIILGAAYFIIFDKINQSPDLIYGEKIKLRGIISESEQRLNSQKIVLAGNIQITTGRYPEFEYGDLIEAEGVIKTIPPERRGYFEKEGIAGLMQFPQIAAISKGHGSLIKSSLLKVKRFFEASYKKVLPFEKAVFLSGLTLGETAEFSDEFKEKLRLTGTSHLVALSGYNISILVSSLATLVSAWWLTRRFKFPIIILFILGFVVMTGAEASVVRAAIMAMLLLIADKLRRLFYFPNAVAAAALGMVLINPKILAFDIGFQLSFAALLGLVYFRPKLKEKFKIEEGGFFKWRSHFLDTTSAQLTVLPILLYHFGYFSPIGIISNVFILEVIPITMGLGFFTAFAAVLWIKAAWLISIPLSIFLGYDVGVINIFAKIASLL